MGHSLTRPDCLSKGLQWEPLTFLHSQGPAGTWCMLRIDGADGGVLGLVESWALGPGS